MKNEKVRIKKIYQFLSKVLKIQAKSFELIIFELLFFSIIYNSKTLQISNFNMKKLNKNVNL